MTRRVILDVDTGSDDAVAIMLAALHPDIELLAVCTVNGNMPVENTTRNTLKVLDLVKSDAPVYRGCPRPLVKELCPWRIKVEERTTAVDEKGETHHIHEDFSSLPESNRQVEKMPASIFYVDYLSRADKPVTLVNVGPLTNLAVALTIDPTIVKNIEEIVIMGGCDRQANATAVAEFNFFGDPEAAQIVVNAGAKITIVPLDATHKAMVTKDDCRRFEEINTPAAKFAIEMCENRILVHTQQQPLELPDACSLHDPLTIAYLIDPSVLQDVKNVHLDVSLSGASDGSCLVDKRYFQEERNVYFAYGADRLKFVDILCTAFAYNKLN